MINNRYQLYVDNVLNLAETIVIKFDAAAEAMNLAVIGQSGYGAVHATAKRSWKYYQNISGRYHFTDAMIQVNSLDLTEKIDFTTANLAVHTATRKAYAYGSRYYRDLLQQHPEQELLILGILYPCDIDQAVAASDGTILSYPAQYVEATEYTLIFKLQDWIYKYLARWVNKPFALSDDLYVATYIGQLYLHLVQAIFNLRLEACKTNEVHSFHIQQFLASHGMLDAYLTTMTRDQALFFYRNVQYIQRNAGKRDTFDWLVDKVMTRRNLPLYAYSMSHDLSLMKRDSPEDNAALQPEVTFKRKPLNVPAQVADKTAYTLEEVLGKIRPLASGNAVYEQEQGAAMKEVLTDSLSSVKATKMLESSVIDYTDAVPYPLEGILFHHWLYTAATGRYTATSFLSLPKSGSSVRLQAQDTVALFFYAMNKALEEDAPASGALGLQRIPLLQAKRVVQDPVPPLSTLRAVTSPRYVSEATLAELYTSRVALAPMLSIDAFYDTCVAVFQAAGFQYALYAQQEHAMARGQLQAATARLYSDEVVRLDTLVDPLDAQLSMTYNQWLDKTGLDFSDYTRTEFYELALAVVLTATGAQSHAGLSLGAIQRSMVSLFTQLSSYSVQVVTETNTSSIVIVPHPQLRVGDTARSVNYHEYVDTAPVRVQDAEFTTSNAYVFDLDKVYPIRAPRFSQHWRAGMALPVKARVRTEEAVQVLARVPTGVQTLTSMNFTEGLLALSPNERANLIDMYCGCAISGSETNEVRLQAFKLFVHKQALSAFVFTGATVRPIFPGRSVNSSLNAFTLVSGPHELSGLAYRGASVTADFSKEAAVQDLAAFTLYSHSQGLPAFTHTGATIQASFSANGIAEDLAAFVFVGNDKELGAFVYTGGLFVQDF